MKKHSFFIWLLCFCSFFLPINASEESAYYHIINYDLPLSFEDIKSHYTSYDKVDGDISDQIQFSSEYEKDYINNTLKVMDYPLKVQITNSRGYTTEQIDIISVRDFTAPKIDIMKDEIEIDIATQDIQTEIFTCFSIKDNYDTEFSIEWIGLEELKHGPGDYLISFIAYDASKNASKEETLIIHLKQTTFTHVCKSPILIQDHFKSKSELLEEWKKTEDFLTDYKSIVIESNYFSTPNKKGTYQAIITLKYPDGTTHIYQCKIINEYTKPNNKIPIFVFITLGSMIAIGLFGIIIYRKRR